MNICHTATAIDIVDNQLFLLLISTFRIRINLQQQSHRTGHRSSVTTGVEVSDLTLLQVPLRTDMHRLQVVAAKETTDLEGSTGRIGIAGVEAHLRQTGICQQVFIIFYHRVNDRTRIVHIDDGLIRHRRIVTAAEGIYHRATHDLQVGLAEFGLFQIFVGISGLPVAEFLRSVVIGTVTATEELTEIDLTFLVGLFLRIRRTDTHEGIPRIIHTVCASRR